VLSFLPDPARAVAEMARVTCPGGWVGTYMWDIQGGGSPTTPIYAAMESLGVAVPVRPNPAASRLEAMHHFWEMAGLETIETCVIRIPVSHANFNEFWDSNSVPIGPQGKVIAGLTPDVREQLRARLRTATRRFRWKNPLRVIRQRREGSNAKTRPLKGRE
jgi:hypothetical protein